MHLDHAIQQLSEIHAQLLRTEVFRGYRSRPMAFTGFLAFAAAATQAAWLPPANGAAFAQFWIAVAGICGSVCALDLMLGVWCKQRPTERAQLLRVVAQLVPAFVAGAVLPLVLVRPELAAIGLLPGLWALVFGLAVFASRPFLPRAIGWVGLWYCGSGVVQVLLAGPSVPGPWGMGITFGVGQVVAALVLHQGVERGA
jgi:hypothetical protein